MAHTIVTAQVIQPQRFGDKAKVIVEFSDQSEELLFTFFSDELSFTADEFIGLTKDQAFDLFAKKDTAYLRS